MSVGPKRQRNFDVVAMVWRVPASGLRLRTWLLAASDFCEERVRGHRIALMVRFFCSQVTDTFCILDRTMIGRSMSSLIGVLTTIEFALRLCYFFVQHDIKCKRKGYEEKKRIPRERFDWADFRDSLSSHQFRRMFRMSKMDFDALCPLIITAVGEENFKAESFIKEHLITTGEDHAVSTQERKKRRMYYANCHKTGGYINGETKLSITLRLMAGG